MPLARWNMEHVSFSSRPEVKGQMNQKELSHIPYPVTIPIMVYMGPATLRRAIVRTYMVWNASPRAPAAIDQTPDDYAKACSGKIV